MKTILLFSLTTALFTNLVCSSSARSPGAAVVFTSVFAAGLVVWTIRQYDRRVRPLTLARPLRLDINAPNKERAVPPRRAAA